MMSEITRNDLRKFGITLAVVLSIIATVLLCHGKIWLCKIFYIGSVGVLITAIFVPYILKPVYIIMMKISMCIGKVVSFIILCILFYMVITPIGIIIRIFGKDLLDRRFDRNAKTYWISREKVKFDKTMYEKQF
jgi:phosphotransferase system  glucose/maltose/N-acetylglucosamine-specific IIC component